ncbi:anthranilate phosphoribosyltransferase [Accumulibacter sp.]|uniref:anthranilate phosphoribosyltransferase n=1 Tax=Accumulibacter sp. TaxID=2053492 RepID=UPI00258C6429|nr:anthranilate phosphoribosyltransferase [Accumulibacter sp.]
MKPQDALTRVIEHREIFHDEMVSLMRQIMSGEVTPVMIAAIITGLRVKKETIGEISAAAQVMRELSTKVQVSDRSRLVDTCGTGGDGAQTFNISTAAMFVAAAAGARVAKHGGRSVSSQSGSADVLEALGVNINLTPAQVGQSVDEVGIGFMFAPNHHSAMKYAAPVRRELGVRTLFNILGPLTNPANAANQVLGVFHPDLVGIQARVLQRLGSSHALVVFGREGLDEISISGHVMSSLFCISSKNFCGAGMSSASAGDCECLNFSHRHTPCVIEHWICGSTACISTVCAMWQSRIKVAMIDRCGRHELTVQVCSN